MSAPLLEVRGVTLRFSGLVALSALDLCVGQGQMLAVIGPNGAGKTSLFNSICGLYRPQQGEILLDGQRIDGLPPHRIAALGVARMFQNLALFENLTVLQNLLVGAHHGMASTWLDDLLWTPRARREEVRARALCEQVIEFLELEAWRHHPAGLLPYGVRKRVELGRALAMQPRLLLLDEPAAGLNREEKEELASFLIDVRSELGITQILIEHELGFVMDLADRVAVLDFGRKLAEGTPEQVRADPRVLAAYLGKDAAAQQTVEASP